MAELDILPDRKAELQKRQAKGVNKQALRCPWRREYFQDLLWQFHPPHGCTTTAHQQALAKYCKWAALKSFGSARSQPMKSWISPLTWGYIQLVAPLRRTMHAAFGLANSLQDEEAEMRTRLDAIGKLLKAAIRKLVTSYRLLLAWDRHEWIQQRAGEAQQAKEANDTRSCFAIARSLGAGKPKPLQVIGMKDGRRSGSELERKERWQEHFAEVFHGSIARLDTLSPCGGNASHPACPDIDVSAPTLQAAIARSKDDKGMGRDELPNEVLKAGGAPLACKLSTLAKQVVDLEQWPAEWQGGRVVDIFKHKGSPLDCDAYRGILLAAHMMKVVLSQLLRPLAPVVDAHLPLEQMGAVASRGTDFGTHLVTSFQEAVAVKGWSSGLLFVDLTKAFDRVLRELLFGFPISGKDNPRQYLQNLGVAEEQASWICDWIEEKGPLFAQWGGAPKADAAAVQLARWRMAGLCGPLLGHFVPPRGATRLRLWPSGVQQRLLHSYSDGQRCACSGRPYITVDVCRIISALVDGLPPCPCDCQGHAPTSGWQGSRTRAHDSGGHIFC